MYNRAKIEKLLKLAIFIGLLALLIIVFSQKIEFTSVDLGRHLENGKIILSDRQVLFKNLYSYTEPDTIFINHHWLAGVIYYGVYLVGGFKSLSILNILLILSAFILSFKLAKKRAGFYISALLAIPVIFLMGERVEVRPEIFSYFFIILTWYILDYVSEKKNYRFLYWLVPLFALWVNIHIYFFIGLALVAFKSAAEFLPVFIISKGDFKQRFFKAWNKSRLWIINLGVLFLTCLFNPNFIRGLLYPFNIFKNYAYEIAENKSVFYLEHLMVNYNIHIFKILIFLLLLSFFARFYFLKKLNLFEIFVGIFFSLSALFAVRNLAIFSLVSLVLLSENLVYPLDYLKKNILFLRLEIRDKYRLYFAVFILLIILISIPYLIIDSNRLNHFMKSSLGWGLKTGSEESIDFFRENKLSGPIFNNYDLGSALIFWLYPSEKVFVDNRPEAYSNDFFNNIYRPMQMERAKWLEYSAKYNFKIIYFSHTDFTPWAQKFLGETLDTNWSLVYFDRYTVIYLNKTNNDKDLIKKLEMSENAVRERLRSLATSSDLEGKLRLASFAGLTRHADLAEEIYRDIIFEYPENALVYASLGSLFAGSQDRQILLSSLDYYKIALASGYRLPGIYNQMGLVEWRLGRYENAESNWQGALKLERKNTSALYYLDQVNKLRLQGELK